MKIKLLLASFIAFVAVWAFAQSKTEKVSPGNAEVATVSGKPNLEELRKQLNPLQYKVTQECGTEPPFQNAYWDNKKPGIYVDVVSGEALFSSLDKYDSGSGWPSFTRPVAGTEVVKKEDATLGITRVEVRSKGADSHLGHLFDDGPAPMGQRYCINSASLRFIPVEEMEAKGYGKLLGPFAQAGLVKTSDVAGASPTAKREVATLAGGCFWGMEEIIRKIPGVTRTAVGYTGGTKARPSYKEVCTGLTGHAEAVEIEFDPGKISYEGVLKYFFRMHDPTTLNQQHNDIGTQYRSAIFYKGEEQKKTAERVIQTLDKAKKFKSPIVTQVVAASEFYEAETYHQKYLVKNPGGYNCHVLQPE